MENTCVELIQTIIWAVGLLIGDEVSYQKVYLSLNCVTVVLTMVSALGEEVYENNYSQLSQMISYMFNNLTWSYDEIGFDGCFENFDQLKLIVPFTLETIVRQATHGSIGSELHGPTGFSEVCEEDVFWDGPDVLEIYGTLEVLLHMGGEDTHEIMVAFPQIELFIK